VATDLANLQTTKASITAQIVTLSAALTSSTADQKSYSIEGQSVTRRWVEDKLQMLIQQLAALNDLIAWEDGPVESITIGIT
jgi:hypothetical protein